MAASIKMDELLVSWLASDSMYENVLNLIEENKLAAQKQQQQQLMQEGSFQEDGGERTKNGKDKDSAGRDDDDANSNSSPRCVIPKFYLGDTSRPRRRRRLLPMPQSDTWEPLPEGERQSSEDAKRFADGSSGINSSIGFSGDDGTDLTNAHSSSNHPPMLCVRDQVLAVYAEIGQGKGDPKQRFVPVQEFVRITKDIFRFPTFFNYPLCQRLFRLWREHKKINTPTMDLSPEEPITYEMVEWFWLEEMEPYDAHERFFRLCKKTTANYIVRDDFLPFIKALLSDHPVRVELVYVVIETVCFSLTIFFHTPFGFRALNF
jgi:EF-hand domain